jgi:hypothetical protein
MIIILDIRWNYSHFHHGIYSITKAHEKRILYRSTAESLKRDYTPFSMDSGEEYTKVKNPEEKNALFINILKSRISFI